MMLSLSLNLWEQIPLLAFIQFPHRLLGPLALILAILAGAAVAILPNRWSFIFTGLGISLIFITTVPLLYPRYYPQLSTSPSLLDMMAYEHRSGAIGTTSFGEYLPLWVKQTPTASPLEAMYQTKTTIQRLDQTSLPPAATLESAQYRFNQADLLIDSPYPYQAIYQTFYFPGWQATIDGQPTALTPTLNTGLISLNVPAGKHHLHLAFNETPLRKTANTISLITFFTILTTLTINLKLKTPPTNYALRTTHYAPRTMHYSPPQLLTLTAITLILISLKLIYLDPFDNPLKQSFDGTNVTWATTKRPLNFGQQINLLAYTLTQPHIEAGQPLDFTAYWQARQILTTDYSALAQLVDPEGHIYGGQDNLHPGSLRSSAWQPDAFVQDPHLIPVPPGTPPGNYLLLAGPYNPTTGARLPILTEDVNAWGDVIAIPVSVTRPAHIPTLDTLGIEIPFSTDFGSELRLLGLTWEQDTLQRNDYQRISLFWESLTKPTHNYQISLRLLDPARNEVVQQVTQPSFNRYPTTQWLAGERVRDNHAIWVPANFPPGTFTLQLRVLYETGQPIGDWVELGQISAPESS